LDGGRPVAERRGKRSMPRVGFEPTITVFEWSRPTP
jgi:hypothetical protein